MATTGVAVEEKISLAEDVRRRLVACRNGSMPGISTKEDAELAGVLIRILEKHLSGRLPTEQLQWCLDRSPEDFADCSTCYLLKPTPGVVPPSEEESPAERVTLGWDYD
jgi:hypothetical protein